MLSVDSGASQRQGKETFSLRFRGENYFSNQIVELFTAKAQRAQSEKNHIFANSAPLR
jgi:hypothetical protein